MRILSLILLFVFTMQGFAQQSKTLPFKVTNNKKVKVLPEGDFLFAKMKNKIVVKIEGKTKIANVKLEGGKISQTNDTLFIAEIEDAEFALLSVYETLPNGNTSLAYTKQYKVIGLPVANVNGVKSDSAINKHAFIGGTVSAYFPGTDLQVKVISFEMEDLYSDCNRLSEEMRNRAKKLKNGSVVILNNIRVVLPDGSIQKIASLQLFILEEEKPIEFRF